MIDIAKRVDSKREKIRKKIGNVKKSRILRILTPKKEIYRKKEKELKKARINLSVEGFQLVRIAVFVLVSVLVTTAFYTNYRFKTNEILNKKSINIDVISFQNKEKNDDIFLNKLTKEAYEKIDYEKLIEGGEYEKLQKQIYNLIKESELDRENTINYAEKVYQNLLFLNENKIGKFEILMIILLSFSSVLFPNMVLRFRIGRTEELMEKELNKLEILTLLFLKKDDMNMYQLLIRLKSKSNVFRPYLASCINNYQKNGRKAMEVMQREADYKPFSDFINILKQGIDTNRKTTFSVLDMSRRLRNELYKLMVKEKNRSKNRKILLTRFPVIMVALYLLILPWLIIFRENF